MQWDHLRTFEAVARLGSLTAASKALGVSQSTVSRQLSKLEENAGSPLLLRESPVRLTARGTSLREAIQPMVEAALVAEATLEDTTVLQGQVTLTTMGEWVRWVLAKRLAHFYRAYPGLRLRILVNNEIASLAAGEADLALRAVKPERGDLVAKKLYTVHYGFFVTRSLAQDADVPWLGLTGTLAQIPEQKQAERTFGARPARLLVEDVETLGLAVEAGLGVAVLPHGLAARLEDIVEVSPTQVGGLDTAPLPGRDFWMVVHRSKQQLPKIRAVMEWLAGDGLTGPETKMI